ncbi:glycosyltransferase family 2 protein [Oribacterium sp. WCC10]|uniref:glycosyltransferase family 2 protein n=1 Tax=Oribacterium sp. WCC10 TaxID=1855343 RepID=UPI0008E806BA|nr:glycosyltransferase family 2 protein [Oribacterium sp. WCC10]SFG40288.1 Glycosyl transferase family 2 [Oribacterium sp. WCC10]
MITVLLCTYNGAQYVKEQIESIMAQNCSDFDIVVSDDGSSDETLTVVNELMEKHNGRIRLIQQSPPTGSAERHFLKLISEKQYGDSDYIMLSDQDDVWNGDKMEKSLEEMKALEVIYGHDKPLLVHCDSLVVDKELKTISPSYVEYQKMTPSRKSLSQLLVQNNIVGGAMMINRALAELITAVPEHCVMHDQWIALVAAAFGEIRFIPESLYKYRQHGDNVLGAEKGSRIMEVLGRFGIGRKDGKTKAEMDEHSRNVYMEMFEQARCFRDMYDDRLTEKQKDLLDSFISIPTRNRLEKIFIILNHGFTYNMLHRTVGECLFIK